MMVIRRIRVLLPSRFKGQAAAVARRIGEEVASTAEAQGGAERRIDIAGTGRSGVALARDAGARAGARSCR